MTDSTNGTQLSNGSGQEEQSAAPAPGSFAWKAPAVLEGLFWLRDNKWSLSISECMSVAWSAAEEVFAEPDDVKKAIEVALGDPDGEFDGLLTSSEVECLIRTVHLAHERSKTCPPAP